MGRKKYFAALAAAGMIGAMAVGSAFNSYAADGWTKSNDHWTYIYQGKTYTGWLETSEGKYYMDLSDGQKMVFLPSKRRNGTEPLGKSGIWQMVLLFR